METPSRQEPRQAACSDGISRPRPWSPAPLVSLSIGVHLGALAAVAARPALWRQAATVLAANHALLGAAGMMPRSQLLGRNLNRLPTAPSAAGWVALTFDDG